MRRILADVWGIDLRIVRREFTLVGENPALDAFIDMAARIKTEAETAALETGEALARRAPSKIA